MRKRKPKGRVGRRHPLGWLARLPWWILFPAAGATWYYLSLLAANGPPAITIRRLEDLHPALMAWAPWVGSYVGQYLLPIIFSSAGLTSLWNRWRNRRLIRKALDNPRNTVNGMDWREFEHLTAELFRARGYRVQMTEAGADGGVDLVVYRGGNKAFVQCKQWKSTKVGVGVVRELYGVMSSEGVNEGYVVTCGQFTEAARDFAHGLNIDLIDYAVLRDWLSD